MKIKNILLTGDDGYYSIGTRLLVHYFADKYKLHIAGTNTQQSGVGGFISIVKGGKWGESIIDGINALWVDQHPVDSIDLAASIHNKKFDLIISGINFGLNVGGSFISSGTIAAALRSLNLGITKKAIAISWQPDSVVWHEDHKKHINIDRWYENPGRNAFEVISLAISENCWGADLLNINLPANPSKKVRFTKIHPDNTKIYKYPIEIDRNKKTFRYPPRFADNIDMNKEYDIGSVLSGEISVSLCQRDLMDKNLNSMLSKTIDLI